MESSNLFGGFRTLLPYEIELCNALGITDKEYLQFLDLTYKYHKDSRKGYELIPDIRCDPVSIGAWYIAQAWYVKLAITVAIAAATYLLTPKPKPPADSPSLQIGGIQGRSRFNPVSGFESAQDLAVLGSFIPLVYARLGVRVSSQLLWSQIRDKKYGQEINAICLFSHGEIGSTPEFKTFALGETFLDTFPSSKLKLYFSKGGRANTRMQATTQQPELNKQNRLNPSDFVGGTAANTHNLSNRGNREYDDNDPFMVKLLDGNGNWVWQPSFSSVKTPSSNVKFGLHTPMPNGNAYKINWELLLFPKDMSDKLRDDTEKKRQKIVHFFPRYVCLKSSQYGGNSAHREVNVGHNFDLIIEKQDNELAFIADASDIDPDRSKRWDKFSPWGSSDAKSAADSTREDVDTNMALGEQYMVGSALATVYQETDANIWTPFPVNGQFQGKRYKMKVDEKGWMSFANETDAKMPYESLVIQKCAISTFANTKECDVTQIGIKSIVWRQISGIQNLNECPSRERIVSYEGENGNISLGSVSKYVNRLSFFKLQVKVLNTNTGWTDACSRVFCVRGSTNQPQYNTINIKHIDSKPLEYRFLPVAGNVLLNNESDRQFYILSYAADLYSHAFDLFYYNGAIAVTAYGYFHAEIGTLPSRNSSDINRGNRFTNNIEWVRGGLGSGYDSEGNPIGDGSDAVSDFSPKLNPHSATWTLPSFSWLQTEFAPAVITPAINRARNNGQGEPWNRGGTNPQLNDYVYHGTGPGNQYNNWGRTGTPSPSIRNFKGTPSYGAGSNSYFSHYHGVELTETEVGGGQVRWQYWFGGTLIPSGSLAVMFANKGDYSQVNNWSAAVEANDSNGNPTGVWHRFKIARNPSSLGSGHDWRYSKTSNGVKTNYYAISVQVQDRNLPTPTVQNFTVVNQGDATGTGLQITRSSSSWTNDNGQTVANVTYAKRDGYSGTGYFTGDQVKLASNVDPHVTFNLIAGTPFVDPDQTFDDGQNYDLSNFPSHNTYFYDQRDINPNNAIADYFMYDAEDSSHSNSPEHEITHVNEIIDEGTSSANALINYEKLAIGGLRIGASQNFNQFTSLSCFIEEGIKVQRLISDSGANRTIDPVTGKSNLFASTDNIVEIVYDLLTNTDYGAGDIAGIKAVNVSDMQKGAKYCLANGFAWNGIIDKELNLRDFIFENAGYCFLDFCIVGGQFSLKPGLPTNPDGSIRYNITRTQLETEVKGLFTDGNMKDVQVTFLTPEERRMFKATVIYRQNEKDGFPETKAKTIAYRKENQGNDAFLRAAEALPEEVFDMSAWCVSESHAKKFAAYALATRKDVDHGITFETTPISVLNLMAGDYIRVMTEATHTSRFKNGSIDNDLNIVSRETISGSQKIYYWKPGENNVVNEDTFVFAGNGTAPSGVLKNTIFTVVDETNEDRLYKIESITHGEEGFIKIAASHVPFVLENGVNYMSVLRHTNPSDSSFAIRFPDVNTL